MALFKTSDDVYISYELDTTGKNCIVLLHGLGGNLTAWNPIRKYLNEAGFKTLAINLRGHADSGRPHKKSGYDFSRIAKDVTEILNFEKIHACVLVGHCFGGVIALYIAAKHPHGLKKLILINGAYKKLFSNSLFSNKFSQNILLGLAHILPAVRFKRGIDFQGYKGTGDHDIKRIASDIIHTSAKSYMFLLSELLSFNATSKLAQIKTPTLILSGSKDSVYPTRISKEMVEKISNAKLEILNSENHIVVINNPSLTAQKIIQFVNA